MSKETGGGAFPFNVEGSDVIGDFKVTNEGMTLRDYFASHSKFGINQAIDVIKGGRENRSVNDTSSIQEIADTLANINYLYADAMIKEKNK